MKIHNNNFPNEIELISTGNEHEIFKWVQENIGCFSINWDLFYFVDRTRFMFKTNEDMMLFALRWI